MCKNNPALLALETSTSACSAAIAFEGQVIERYDVGNNIHSKELLSMVDSLFREFDIRAHQLDAIVVGQGPGSFTGLRIGVGIGQGIAFGANKPMIGVSSLDAMADFSVGDLEVGQTLLVAMDARMNEVYWAQYKVIGSGFERNSPILVGSPESIKLAERPSAIAGNAFEQYEGRFDQSIPVSDFDVKADLPRASMLLKPSMIALREGKLCSAADFAPIYVRNDVAKKSTKKGVLKSR